MWTLVAIKLLAGEWMTYDGGTFNTMWDCFHAREQLMQQVNLELGNGSITSPPPGMQIVCIRTPTST